MTISRRAALLGLSASTLAGACASNGFPAMTFAHAGTDKRLVAIFLRGGVDGLSLVPPYAEPTLKALRGPLVDDMPGSGGPNAMHKLDGMFAVNPDLPFFHELFSAGELVVLHSTASPYRDRSHFDAQDVVDRGTTDRGLRQGWLNRVVGRLPDGGRPARADLALGVGPTLPLSLRGPEPAGSWSPPVQSTIASETFERLAALYRNDADLGAPFINAVSAGKLAGGVMGAMGASDSPFEEMATVAAGFLRERMGPRIVTIDFGNWDSHSDQNARELITPQNQWPGRYPSFYRKLNSGMRALRTGLGSTWQDTAVLIFTEFGRTVRVNGTNGTDHGTAGAAMLAGGAVAGGRVISDWRGLAPRDLLEDRDLYPTTDIRSLFKATLREHMGLSDTDIETTVFPQTASIGALEGLFRA